MNDLLQNDTVPSTAPPSQTSDAAEAPPADATSGPSTDPGEQPTPDRSSGSVLAERPGEVPEKFWDPERGEIRTEALLKSYAELERRLSRSLPIPEGEEKEAAVARLRRALGWPETPEGYEITPPHPALEPDPELNRRLHEAGFTNEQAQLVYELAAEKVLPAVDEVVGTLMAEREREKLAHHFGGEESFARIAREIRSWAEAHLEPEVYETLSSSYQGVLTLHQMMQAQEPRVVGEPGSGSVALDEDQLYEMMRDPRYWRDRDPEFIARVTEGFRQLYGE